MGTRINGRSVAFISRLIEIASNNVEIADPRQKDFALARDKIEKRDGYPIKGTSNPSASRLM